MIRTNITLEAAVVDSSSMIISLLRDLEELMNREDDLIAHVKGQIKILHQGLMLSHSFLKDIKVLQLAEIEELKEVVMRIRDAAFEAEYLINSFLVRDAPHCAQLSLQAKRNFDVEDIVVGFEDNTIDILDKLVGGTQQLKIISIFGMPGLGKTTLAKILYNHPSVNHYFDKCSWCIISQAYQIKSVLTDILTSSESELDRAIILNMEEESLAERIYKSLKGRRYLIVMDDIWNSDVWNDLSRCFPNDGNGSRILFTSRNKDAAPPNSTIHELPTLSNGQCWELLQKKVFGNESCPPQLLDIGNQIATSCCGLPLAVVVVAGILSTMGREKSAWENVGGSLASYIFAEGNNSTMQILELSYKHLLNHLKPCFLYFGVFSEDKEIPVRKLLRLWIVEGLICKEERKSVESVAEEYLMGLIGKSLVIITRRRSDGGVKNCVIHDLLRDLCLRRAEEENFLKLVDNNYLMYGKCHRLYAPLPFVSLNPIFKASHLLLERYVRHVRSFFGYTLDSPLDVLNMELLRVLDCWQRYCADLQTLVHLRYLAICPMPVSITSLVNLEFLIVHGKVSISSSLLKMPKLRYLQAREAIFDKDCNSTQMVINNLEYLSNVCISNLKDAEMLKCTPHLRKLKCRDRSMYSYKSHLRKLKCRDRSMYSYKLPPRRCPDLHFLTQLESLTMDSHYSFSMYSNFKFPPNIKKLTLSKLSLPWEMMSSIGTLQNLKVLKLGFHAFRGEVWETRDGEFQQLRFLKLKRLSFVQWNVSTWEHFPKLYQLVLHRCDKLKEIPCEIGEIPTLQMIEVKSCKKSVAESAVQIEQEQRDMGNEDLRVVIL
ncbi:hypothetical protein BUALT_Bualt06G0089800 [Buddleja alternifolia]|uniref:Uncharacterized protein n=1 Tax=Buddleja alternifolia TaxID=168488 RepID=A0AAV6XLP0_9LAMI|nr:hypothetical protein BUALT_Bualt06G0089800 [Buddleja alternifolia]